MSKWKKIAAIIILIIVFFFIGLTLYQNWQEVKIHLDEIRFNIWFLLISFIFLLVNFTIAPLAWRLILKGLGENIPIIKSIQINTVALLGRFVPGKFMAPLGRIYFAKQYGIPPRKTFVSILFNDIFGILSALILFSVSLIFLARKGLPNWIYSGLVFIPICLIVLHPKIHPKIINLALKIFKREPINFSLSFKKSPVILLFFVACWIAQGACFFFLIKSFYSPIKYSFFIPIIGMQAIAWVIGYISILVPGGLGVREGVLSFLLKFYLPVSIGILSALLYRIWTIIGTLIFFLVFARGLAKELKEKDLSSLGTAGIEAQKP